jgi:hypothetical protein
MPMWVCTQEMHVYMYACIHVTPTLIWKYMYVLCVYIHVYVCECICYKYVYTYTSMHLSVCDTCKYIYMHGYIWVKILWSLATKPNTIVFIWIKLKGIFSFVILKGILENHKLRYQIWRGQSICFNIFGYQNNSLDEEKMVIWIFSDPFIDYYVHFRNQVTTESLAMKLEKGTYIWLWFWPWQIHH